MFVKVLIYNVKYNNPSAMAWMPVSFHWCTNYGDSTVA